MILVIFDLAEHIEEENAHIFVEILVVEEEFREEGQVLAIDRVFIAIDLENCNVVLFVAIDLIARRVIEGTDERVAFEFYLQGEEAEAEIADVETVKVVIVDGVGTEVPGIRGIFAELQPEYGFKLGDFLVSQEFGVVHAEVRVVVGMDVRVVLLGRCTIVDFDVGAPEAGVGYPVVVALVEVLEVHVVGIGILISWFGGVIIYNQL